MLQTHASSLYSATYHKVVKKHTDAPYAASYYKKKETNRVKLTVGGQKNDCLGVPNTLTEYLTTIKAHFNSVISTEGDEYMFMCTKVFYLNMPIPRYEYAIIPVYMIPE